MHPGAKRDPLFWRFGSGRQRQAHEYSDKKSPLHGVKLAQPGQQLQCPLWVKSRHSDHPRSMSALPPKADIVERDRHVRFVPKADIDSLFDHLVGNREQP